jgi:hypothetical protein
MVCLATALVPGGPTKPAAAAGLPPSIRLDGAWQMQDVAKVAESAEQVSEAGYKPKAWYNATVPGTVLTTLVNNGVYPEPLYGLNNYQIPESLCKTSYWYRTTFTLSPSWKGRQVWLDFEGINYTAEAYVNGHSVGTMRGAFLQGMFDATKYAKIGTENVLAVRVDPQPHVGTVHHKTMANGVGPNGGESARDGATFLSAIGWNWITTVHDRDTGIWRSVYVVPSGPVTIENPYVRATFPTSGFDSADLTVSCDVHNQTDHAISIVLTGAIGETRFSKLVTLAGAETQTVTWSPSAGTAALHVMRPRLWWPNGYGAQNLYRLDLAATVGGQPSDSQSTDFGIRKITYFVAGSDNLHLTVNGVPIMVVGGNWGMDEAMKRIPRSRLNAMVRMHQIARFVMIRNWVGQSTDEDFFDLCDRYGIMVWDEFFQPNPADGPNPDDAGPYLQNAADTLLRYRNHPSIAVWCGRNEGAPPASIDAALGKLVSSLDGVRYYQSSSTAGHGVQSGGPYSHQSPSFYFHVSQVFKTEMGQPSVPTAEGIKAMMPQQDWWPPKNDDWAEHDMTHGSQGGDTFPEMLNARYGPATDVDDFARKAQLVNYENFRAIYEGRNAAMWNPATGIMIWMTNPAEPSFIYQLYGHDLEPTASLYGARKANELIHVQLDQATWHVELINHLPSPVAGASVAIDVYNLDGKLMLHKTMPAAGEPESSTDLGAIDWSDGLSDVHFVRLHLTDSSGKLLSDNFYWRAVETHPNDFTALSSLAQATVSAIATSRLSGPNTFVTVHLRNTSPVVALAVHVSLRARAAKAHGADAHGATASDDERVLPAYADDDYVSLVPGQERTVTIEADTSNATATHLANGPAHTQCYLVVRGFNMAQIDVPINEDPSSPSSFSDLVEPPIDTSLVDTPSFRTLVPPAPPAARVTSVAIACGGPGAGRFQADSYRDGGNDHRVADKIDTSAPDAAPMAVYQSEVYDPCTFTIPMAPLKPGETYTVRLHFSENTWNQPGARKFNVDINGVRKLTDFDILAAAGAKFKAVVKEFTGIPPTRNGNVVISLTAGTANRPKIDGIEVVRDE